MCVFFHISFPSSTLLMEILLFTHEILFRIYLKRKGDLIPKALSCSAEASYFLWVSEVHSCWGFSQVFLEQSLFSFYPVSTPRMTMDMEEWEKLSPRQVSAQNLLVSREVRRRPESWELLWAGDGHALFSGYDLLLLRMKFIEVVRGWIFMGMGIWNSFQASYLELCSSFSLVFFPFLNPSLISFLKGFVLWPSVNTH